MAKTADEAGQIARDGLKTKTAAPTSHKRVPRDPTPAMATAMQNARMPITINDTPGWLAVWQAGYDACDD